MASGSATPWFSGMSRSFSMSRNSPYTTFPMGEVDMEYHAIRLGPSDAGALFIVQELCRNFETRSPWVVSCRRPGHNLPMHQFRLALHLVQVVYRGACFDTHGVPPLFGWSMHALAGTTKQSTAFAPCPASNTSKGLMSISCTTPRKSRQS